MERGTLHEWVTGIDIGGSHITVGMVNMQTRSVVEGSILRGRVDCHADADTILSSWCKVIRDVWQKFAITPAPLGFAMPGPFDYTNGICLIKGFDKYESLYEMDIREALAERLGINGDEICFRNDAEAFLEGEMFCGSAEGYTDAIVVTLGTGLGTATSHHGISADAELSVIPYKGEKIEEFVSTRGLVRAYESITCKKLKDGKAVADLYDTDENARSAFKTFSNDLRWFLEYFIRKEEPQVLVIGGNIIQSWDLFMPEILDYLSAALPNLPKIVKATLGESAALIGGACCFNALFTEHVAIQSNIAQKS